MQFKQEQRQIFLLTSSPQIPVPSDFLTAIIFVHSLHPGQGLQVMGGWYYTCLWGSITFIKIISCYMKESLCKKGS